MPLQLPLDSAPLFPDLSPRGNAYVWATWLASYLVGDVNCDWSLWLRAHYRGWKSADDPGDQMAIWHVNHTALLRQLATVARNNGERVWVEAQNAFRLVTPSGATLAGKPDLVTQAADGTVTVTDAKTGQRKSAHRIQVMLYQWALRQADPRFKGGEISGRVVYADGEPPVPILPGAVNAAFEQRVLECLTELAAPLPPHRLPSRQECHFCPIGRSACPERVEWDVEDEPAIAL